MPSTHLDAYLAVPMPFEEIFEDGSEKKRTILYAMLDELCALSGQMEFKLEYFGVCRPKISLLEGRKGNRKLLRQLFGVRTLQECEILRISASVAFSVDAVPMDDNPELSADENAASKELCEVIIRESFIKHVSNMLIAANLARVGSVELKKSAVVQDDTIQKFVDVPPMDSSSLRRSVELVEKIGWPKLHVIDLMRIWSWLAKHEDFFSDGFSDSPVGRALSAFSRVFEYSTRDEPMQLLWALIGVESLYVKGQMALLEQVREKTQVFLGPQESYKKRIASMYDFRSRFVHGDLNFPSLYSTMDDYETFGENLLESISMAVAVLIATLQEMIQRDWSVLEFTYDAVGGAKPGG